MKHLSLWRPEEWSLLGDIDRIQGTMNSLFEDFGKNARSSGQTWPTSFLSPPCDVQETEGHYVLSLDLPGLKKDEIKIELLDTELVVSGERKKETQSASGESRRTERFYGRFERRFSLPAQVDANSIEAEYEDGVLSLVIPKAEAVKPKQIKIEANRKDLMDKVFGKKSELKEVK